MFVETYFFQICTICDLIGIHNTASLNIWQLICSQEAIMRFCVGNTLSRPWDLLLGFIRFRCAISSGNISDFLGKKTRRESLRSARWQVYGHVGIPRFSRTPRNDFLCYKYQYWIEIAEGVNTNERYILPITYTHTRTQRENERCVAIEKARGLSDTVFTRWLDYGVYMHWWVRLMGF